MHNIKVYRTPVILQDIMFVVSSTYFTIPRNCIEKKFQRNMNMERAKLVSLYSQSILVLNQDYDLIKTWIIKFIFSLRIEREW